MLDNLLYDWAVDIQELGLVRPLVICILLRLHRNCRCAIVLAVMFQALEIGMNGWMSD